MLKIAIVHAHADGVSKSLSQRPLLLARGKILYFRTIKDTNRDSAHPSQNKDNFPTFSLGLEFLKERKTTEKGSRHQSRHDSLHCPRVKSVKCNKFWQKDTLVKPSKWQTGLFQPSKLSLNFSVLKLFNVKLELSTENSERTITSDIVVRFSRGIWCSIPPAML